MPDYQDRNYTHFQLIAYEAPTSDIVDPGEDPGGQEGDELGKLPADERIRIRRLAAVVDKAWQLVGDEPGAASKTLKIFLAPEFYFRPAGKEQPYNSYSEGAANEIKRVLLNLFSEERFADWLIVPGTIIWNRPMPWGNVALDSKLEDYAKLSPDSMKVDPSGADYSYFNTALVIKGGAKEAPWTSIDKRDISSSDKLPKARNPANHPALQAVLGSWVVREKSVFEIDHIRFGLEVCMDHQTGSLKAVMEEGHQLKKLARTDVDLHLAVCCGQGLRVENCVAREGGYFLHVDGNPFVGTQSFNSSLCPIPKGALALEMAKRKLLVQGEKINAKAKDVQITLLSDALVVPPGEQATACKFQQRLLLYPSKPLPA